MFAVFKINDKSVDTLLKNLSASAGNNVFAVSKGYLIIDTGKVLFCNLECINNLIKTLVDLVIKKKITFYSYVSGGTFNSVISLLNKLHQEISKKDNSIMFIVYMKALPLNYGHKKEYVVTYFTTTDVDKKYLFFENHRRTVLVATDYGLNIKNLVGNDHLLDTLDHFIRIRNRFKVSFYDSYGTLMHNFFLMKSIVHSKHYTLTDTVKYMLNPYSWHFTILNKDWYNAISYYLRFPQLQSNLPSVKMAGVPNSKITYNFEKLWVENKGLEFRKGYTVDLTIIENLNKNYTSILTEVFSIGEAWLLNNLLERKLISEIPLPSIESYIKDQVKDIESEAKKMFEVSRAIMSKTNFFKVMREGVPILQEMLSDIHISGLFLELKNKHTSTLMLNIGKGKVYVYDMKGRWRLPVLIKFDFGDKQIYTYNVANAMLMNMHFNITSDVDSPMYIIGKKGVKQFKWTDIGIDSKDSDSIIKIIDIAETLKPVKSGQLYNHNNKGFKIYSASEFKSWKDLSKVPLFKVALKLGGDVITFDGNGFSSPEHGVHIFTNKDTSVVFSGYRQFEYLKEEVYPVELKRCARY